MQKLADQLMMADILRQQEADKMHPNQLPGRYGRVISDLQRLLLATDTLAVVAGGWAVWHHGYVGRVTQDVDIVIPQDKRASIMQTAPLSGFQVLATQPGRWPKLQHRETQIDVDFLPETELPGILERPGPTAIRHPSDYGAKSTQLAYIQLSGLFELKLGALRAKDQADLVELIKVNRRSLPMIISSLASLHPEFIARLQPLIEQADAEER